MYIHTSDFGCVPWKLLKTQSIGMAYLASRLKFVGHWSRVYYIQFFEHSSYILILLHNPIKVKYWRNEIKNIKYKHKFLFSGSSENSLN